MAEYIDKKLAIGLMHQSSYLSDGDLLEVNCNLAKARIEAEPAADVVPVVRCGECKYVTRWRSEESAKKFGQVYECARGVLTCPDPNDFCCRGERKES